MSRLDGTFIFPASLEVQIEGPLDARKYNKTYNDLISAEKSSFYYKGMDAVVYDDPDETKNGIYFLKAKPSTVSANWVQMSTGNNTELEFTGTQAEWDALSEAEKAKYDIVYIVV